MDAKRVKKLNDLEVIKKLFNGLTENDILRQVGRDLYVGDKKIPEDIKKQLIIDANVIMTSGLWKLLLDCVKHEANKLIYEKSVDSDSLIFPKASLWTVEILEKKIANLSQL